MSKKRTPMSTGLVAHMAASAAEPSISSGVFSIPEDVAGDFWTRKKHWPARFDRLVLSGLYALKMGASCG